jgi:hypothetical protein
MIMDDYPVFSPIQRRYELLKPVLDERLRRLWVAAEALALGTGGITVLSGATGLSRTTIRAGIEELRSSEGDLAQRAKEGRVRRPGAGRKTVALQDATLEVDLMDLLESSRDEGAHILDWTCKSIRGLAGELAAKGHQMSYRTVGNLLHRKGFRFSPAESYKKFPLASRREQFRGLSRRAALFQETGQPIVALALTQEARHQSVVPGPQTAGLAASVVRYWWRESAVRKLAKARKMLLLIDAAGLPAGERGLWAPLLHPLAADTGLEIVVAHFPPGARRWRRSTQELSCSCSRPAPGGSDELITVELDLILPPLSPDTEGSRLAGAAVEPIGLLDDMWNYRIEKQARSSTT